MTAKHYTCRPWSPVELDESVRVRIVRGDGVRVWDSAGIEYLDAKSGNLSVTCGYNCGPIIDAMTAQVRRLAAFDTIAFDVDATQAYAEAAVGAMPESVRRVFFCNSGSEATECAVVIARAVAAARGEFGRHAVLRLDRGYHGATPSALAASELPGNQRPARDQPPGFVAISTRGWPSPAAASEAVYTAIAAVGADQIAGFIVEPILGVAGVIVPPVGYLKAVAEAAADIGALLILDEVFTGMGRTGQLFAAEHDGLEPDLLLASKGLTSGYVPLAAVGMAASVYADLAREPILRGLPYGHTSSGHAVACAAGLAALRFTVQQGLAQRATDRGTVLLADLSGLVGTGGIVDVRGRGLMLGVEFETAQRASRVCRRLLARGIIVRSQGNVLTVAPPLIIDVAGCARIAEGIASAARAEH